MNPIPLAAKPEDKRSQILSAARRLLKEEGYQDIVLDDIARVADVAKGTLYLYFRNKEDLFLAAFEDLVTQLGEKLVFLLKSDKEGEALLTDTVRTILSHFDLNKDFVSQLACGKVAGCGSKSSGKLLDKFSANVDVVVQILRRCSSHGIDIKDFPYSAVALVGLCRSVMFQHMLTDSKELMEKETRKVVNFFLNGASGR
ncbi:MAG: TetR/AcrR family transcriptional regulator [Elusimicrobia bacterium]|nr:TetR/AcrR family transcriptional regulator [Elusimicrobiota bacterium]